MAHATFCLVCLVFLLAILSWCESRELHEIPMCPPSKPGQPCYQYVLFEESAGNIGKRRSVLPPMEGVDPGKDGMSPHDFMVPVVLAAVFVTTVAFVAFSYIIFRCVMRCERRREGRRRHCEICCGKWERRAAEVTLEMNLEEYQLPVALNELGDYVPKQIQDAASR